MSTKTLPDFVGIKHQYDQKLSNGQRAEIRRTASLEDLELIPSVYHLGYRPSETGHQGLLQVIYFLPYAEHSDSAESLGKQLNHHKIKEERIFQVVRSEPPQDLYYLRRLCQQAKPTVNWNDFGKLLFFWRGEYSKKQFLEDFFTSQTNHKESKGV